MNWYIKWVSYIICGMENKPHTMQSCQIAQRYTVNSCEFIAYVPRAPTCGRNDRSRASISALTARSCGNTLGSSSMFCSGLTSLSRWLTWAKTPRRTWYVLINYVSVTLEGISCLNSSLICDTFPTFHRTIVRMWYNCMWDNLCGTCVWQ